MLRSLDIKDCALIREMSVQFEEGLGIITGETGAGKSILLDALGLTLGFKASGDLVRSGAEHARVQALFEVGAPSAPSWSAWLAGRGLPYLGDEIWLKRELNPAGRSRCWINGESVPLATLAEAGDLLVDFQGQHEHQSLLRPSRHLGFLDEFGGLLELGEGVRRSWERARKAQTAVHEAGMSSEERQKRLDLLRYQIGELESVAPVPGERAALLAERELGLSASRRHAMLVRLYGIFFGAADEGVLSMLASAAGELKKLAALDPSWEEYVPRLESALTDLSDIASRIDAGRDQADYDPARAEHVEERLHHLELLDRKYGQHGIAPWEFLEKAKSELEALEDHADSLARLEQQLEESIQAFSDAALQLSAARKRSATLLEKAVSSELAELGMEQAVFKVDVDRSPSEGGLYREEGRRYLAAAHGVDRVEFMLSANLGEAPRPLAKVASGGELSRITLALKAALSKDTGVETLVFDEIDAGVSGRVAEIVGEKLCFLARNHQVLCVTHLPQIASRPGLHLRVEKATVADSTVTGIRTLNQKEREREVASMVAGKEISESALRHARQLLSNSGPSN